jgi:hypothetical protein
VRARILGNLGLPEVEGFSIRHFGHYLAPGSPPWRPEMERRNLSDILPLIPAAEKPDILVCGSPEYLPIPWDIHTFPGTKVLLITDWNVCLRFLPDICPLFDFCFVDWPGYRILRKAGLSNVHHQPLFGHDPRRFRFLDKPRDLEVSFCGNLNSGLHGERNRLLARIAWWADRTRRPVHLRQAFGDAYVDILNRSRLVFNYAIRGEANMRLFEAMACGAVPLVEDTNQEAAILFQEGRHYFRYAPGRLEEKLNELLARPERIAAVAEEARREVARHTKARQIENMLETVLRESPSRRVPPMETPPVARRKALAKMRILGMGYTAKEAIEEIQDRAKECPGLDVEALPGLLFALMEREAPTTAAAAGNALEHLLNRPELPDYLRIFLQMLAAMHGKDWSATASLSTRCLEALARQDGETFKTDGAFFRFLLPPLNLGKGMNADINQVFLAALHENRPEMARTFIECFCHYSYSSSTMQMGSIAATAKMSTGCGETPFNSIPRHQLHLEIASLSGSPESIKKACRDWFEESPLDSRAWERILGGLETAGSEKEKIGFLKEIHCLAVHFMDADQADRIKALLPPLP